MKTSMAWVGAVLLALGCGGSPAADQDTTASSTAEAEAEATEDAADAPEPEPATLLGSWVVDPSCISQQRGMEGADQATVDAVAAQLVQNRFRYTETDFEQVSPALPEPVVQPYTMLSQEASRWTYELAGPTGAPMQITATLTDGQLRLERDGALELCLRRP